VTSTLTIKELSAWFKMGEKARFQIVKNKNGKHLEACKKNIIKVFE